MLSCSDAESSSHWEAYPFHISHFFLVIQYLILATILQNLDSLWQASSPNLEEQYQPPQSVLVMMATWKMSYHGELTPVERKMEVSRNLFFFFRQGFPMQHPGISFPTEAPSIFSWHQLPLNYFFCLFKPLHLCLWSKKKKSGLSFGFSRKSDPWFQNQHENSALFYSSCPWSRVRLESRKQGTPHGC